MKKTVDKSIIYKNFLIREYRRGDFNHIGHLWTITELCDSGRGDDEKTIEDSIKLGGTLLIMEEIVTRKVCGTSWLTFDGRRIHLHHFGILPEFQGLGLSKFLLKKSLDFVKKKGAQVKLEVHKNNTRAVNLYKKYGFKYLGDYEVLIIRDIENLQG